MKTQLHYTIAAQNKKLAGKTLSFFQNAGGLQKR